MNCAEVMEWMHRYLDHDLSQEEMVVMFRHMEDCPSCADRFEQLSLLSEELENLPDVKPPFSLVDAILPQLDEWDRTHSKTNSTEAEGSPAAQSVVPMSRKKTHGKSSWGSSIAARTGIGAAAAAILLGIAIFNMPDKMPGAEVEDMLNQNSTADMKAAPEAGNDNNNTADHSAQQKTASGTGETEATMNSGDGSESPAASGGEEIAMPSSDPSSQAVPDPTERPRTKTGKGTAAPKRNTADAVPTDSINRTAEPSNAKKVVPEDGAADADSAVGDEGISTQSALPDSANEPQEMGLWSARLAPAESSWTSPDGRYVATLEGQQLVIYSLSVSRSAEDRQMLTSIPLEGNWLSGEWSPDSQQFKYVIENENGTAEKRYSPESPASQQPTASPASTAAPAATPIPSPAHK